MACSGRSLTRLLVERGEWVVEVGRPSRPARRGGKSDALDAVRAAREALAQQRPAAPRRRGDGEALRVLLATRQGAVTDRTCALNQLKALIVAAPEELRLNRGGDRRCWKRAIARQLFKLLQRYDRPQVEVVRVA